MPIIKFESFDVEISFDEMLSEDPIVVESFLELCKSVDQEDTLEAKVDTIFYIDPNVGDSDGDFFNNLGF